MPKQWLMAVMSRERQRVKKPSLRPRPRPQIRAGTGWGCPTLKLTPQDPRRGPEQARMERGLLQRRPAGAGAPGRRRLACSGPWRWAAGGVDEGAGQKPEPRTLEPGPACPLSRYMHLNYECLNVLIVAILKSSAGLFLLPVFSSWFCFSVCLVILD